MILHLILALLISLSIQVNVNANAIIDCNDVSYSKNLTEVISIMKYCTGGKKEVK